MLNTGTSMRRETSKILAAGAAFFLITSLTIAWSRFSGGLALIWPGSAILAALLVVLPTQRWFGAIAFFALLSTIATAFFGFGPRVAAPLAVVNVFEGFAIAALLRHFRPERGWPGPRRPAAKGATGSRASPGSNGCC